MGLVVGSRCDQWDRARQTFTLCHTGGDRVWLAIGGALAGAVGIPLVFLGGVFLPLGLAVYVLEDPVRGAAAGFGRLYRSNRLAAAGVVAVILAGLTLAVIAITR